MLAHRLRKLFGFEFRLAQRDHMARRFRPRVEPLEDRVLLSTADLQLTLRVRGSATPGSAVPYTLTVLNLGPDTAQAVSVLDNLPSGLTFLSQSQVSGPAFTLSNSGNQVNDSIASLASHASATIIITASVNTGLADGTAINNTGTVSSSASDPFAANNSATAKTSVYAYSGATPSTVAVTNPGPQFGTEGSSVSLQVLASNPGGGTLTYGATGLPAGLSINANTGLISGTIGTGAAADSPVGVTVTATDGNHSGSQTFRWDIAVPSPGNPITALNPGPQFASEGDAVALQVQASDSAAGTLTYSASGLPTGLAIAPASGVIWGTVAFGAATGNPYTATVTVSDGTHSRTLAFQWSVGVPGPDTGRVVVVNPGNQGNTEGDHVSLQVDASDGSGGTLSYGASGLPAGLSINTTTGAISGTISAGAAQGGPYTVTVTATDGTHSGQQSFTWHVAGPVVVTNPGDQSAVEGATVSLQVQASDSTSGTLTYSATGLPAGLSINAATGLISGTVGAGAAAGGPYTTTVTSTDGTHSDRAVFSWEVSSSVALNGPDDQHNVEGDTVALLVPASDSTGGTLTYSATGLPTGLTIDSATGLISGTITTGAAAGGPYTFTVTATDGTYSDTRFFSWDVAGPVTVVSPGNQSDTEGDAVSLQIEASHPAGATLAYSAAGLPAGLHIDANTGLISGTIAAGASAAGPFAVTVMATDGTHSDARSFSWAVAAPPADPAGPITLVSPNSQSNAEGDQVSLQVIASDSAGGRLSYFAAGLPLGLDIDPTTGLISGTIRAGAAAGWTYQTTVTASDGSFSESKSFSWSVSGPVVMTGPANQTSAEGDHVSLQVHASDGTGGTLSYRATGLPAGLSINATTGVISGTIPAGTADVAYVVTVTASDGTEGDSKTFTWRVASPVAVTSPGSQSGAEGDAVSLQVHATDTAGGTLTYSASGLPAGLSINSSTGVVSGTIASGASGTYTATVTATDGTYSNTLSFGWTVNPPGPPAPSPVVFFDSDDEWDTEGDAVSVQVLGYDSAAGTLTYSATGLPPGLSIDASTGVISGTIAAGAAQGGPYTVTVTATDGTHANQESFAWAIHGLVSVASPGDQGGAEGDVVSLPVQGLDLTGGTLSYSATGLPAGLSIDPTTGAISGTIAAGAALGGPYTVTITASDGTNSGRASFSWDVTGPVTVANPGDQSGTEGNQVALQMRATDSAGRTLTYSATGLPAGLTISATTGLISGVIGSGAAANGPYTITVTVTDGTSGARQAFKWAVAAPGPVRLTSPGNQAGAEGDGIVLVVQATDSSGGTVTYSAVGLPAGLTLDPMTGWITGTITAGAAASGPYQVTLSADDGTYGDSQTFQWAVTAGGPVRATAPGDQACNEGDAIALPIAASDSGGGTLTYSATGLPAGLSISATTGLISGRVSTGAASDTPYVITVTVTDGTSSDRQSFQWSVSAPGSVTVTKPDDQAWAEGDPVALRVQASDSTLRIVTYSATGLPDGLGINRVTGLITGTIRAGAAAQGTYYVTVTADDGPSSDSQTFRWTVSAPGPVRATSPGDQSYTEGDTVALPVSASNTGGGMLSYSATGLPSGLSIDSSTGVISGTITAGAAAGGPYLVTVTVSNGTSSDKVGIQLNVGATNPGGAGPATGTSAEAPFGGGVNAGNGVYWAADLLDVLPAPQGAAPPPASTPSSPGPGLKGATRPAANYTSASFTRTFDESVSNEDGLFFLHVVDTATTLGTGPGGVPVLNGTTDTTLTEIRNGSPPVTRNYHVAFTLVLTADGSLGILGVPGSILDGSAFPDEDFSGGRWSHVSWTDEMTFSDAGTLTAGDGRVYSFTNSAYTTAWRDTTHEGGPPDPGAGTGNTGGGSSAPPGASWTETFTSNFGRTYRFDAIVSDQGGNLPANTQIGSNGYPTNLFADPVSGTNFLARSFQAGSSGGNAKDTIICPGGGTIRKLKEVHTHGDGIDAYQRYLNGSATVKGDKDHPADTDALTWSVDYQRKGKYSGTYDEDLSAPDGSTYQGTTVKTTKDSGDVLRSRFNFTDKYHAGNQPGSAPRTLDGKLEVTVIGAPSSYANEMTHTYTTSAAGWSAGGAALSSVSVDKTVYRHEVHLFTKVTTNNSGTATRRVYETDPSSLAQVTNTYYTNARASSQLNAVESGEEDAVNKTSSIDSFTDLSGSNWSLSRITDRVTASDGVTLVLDTGGFALSWGNSSSSSWAVLYYDASSSLPPDGFVWSHVEGTQILTGSNLVKEPPADGMCDVRTLTVMGGRSTVNQTSFLWGDEYGQTNGSVTETSKDTFMVDTTTTVKGPFEIASSNASEAATGKADDMWHTTATTKSKADVSLWLSSGLPSGTVTTESSDTTAYNYTLDETTKRKNKTANVTNKSEAYGNFGITDKVTTTYANDGGTGARTLLIEEDGHGVSSTSGGGQLSDDQGHTGTWEMQSTTERHLDEWVKHQYRRTGDAAWQPTSRTFHANDWTETGPTNAGKPTYYQDDNGLGRPATSPLPAGATQSTRHTVKATFTSEVWVQRDGTPDKYSYKNYRDVSVTADDKTVRTNANSSESRTSTTREYLRRSLKDHHDGTYDAGRQRREYESLIDTRSELLHERLQDSMHTTALYQRQRYDWTQTEKIAWQLGNSTKGDGKLTWTVVRIHFIEKLNRQTGLWTLEEGSHTPDQRPPVVNDLSWPGRGLDRPAALDMFRDFTNQDFGKVLRIAFGLFDMVAGVGMIVGTGGLAALPGVGLFLVGADQVLAGFGDLERGGSSRSFIETAGYSAALWLGASEGTAEFVGALTPAALSGIFAMGGALAEARAASRRGGLLGSAAGQVEPGPRPLPRDVESRIIKIYPDDPVPANLPGRPQQALTHSRTGEIFVNGRWWDALSDAQKSRVFFEEFFHQRGVLRTPQFLRPVREFAMGMFDSYRFLEEMQAAWFAKDSFRGGFLYAWHYPDISRLRILAEMGFLTGLAGAAAYSLGQWAQ
jgi:uncharacterized repeat protein (TIGR01451 family)